MTMRTVSILSALVMLGLTVGCGGATGGGGGGPSLKDQPLQGTIKDDSDWEYTSASARVDSGDLSLTIYKGVDDPCAVGTGNDDWQILTTVPAEEARHDLSFSLSGGDSNQTVTFAKDGNNIVVSTGFIEITSMGESTVEGDLVADTEEDGTVNGHFEATRCDNQDGGS